MEHLWIGAGLLAALFQALRMAALKQLNRHLSMGVTTYVRVLFGLPILLVYMGLAFHLTGQPFPDTGWRFWSWSLSAALTQFFGTVLIVRLFQLGNFAIGTMLAKTDVVVTAIAGAAFFDQRISALGWGAIAVTLTGVLMASAARTLPAAGGTAQAGAWRHIVLGPMLLIGVASGCIMACSYLSLREAIHAIDPSAGNIVRAGMAGTAMTGLSFLILGLGLAVTEPRGLAQVRNHLGLCIFVGVTSAIGTMFWFLATAMSNAAYVAAVTQVQIVYSLAIGRYWFAERMRPLELWGILVIVAGILLFRLV